MANAHTMDDLRQFQAMPLPVKVAMSKTRIRAWVDQFGTDGVYVSFSGGKDSTVLLHLVRSVYPDVPGVFVDTGLEYPEIRDFVKSFDNIVWLRPKMNFKQVIEKYGYPFFSKETSGAVDEAFRYMEKYIERMQSDDSSKDQVQVMPCYSSMADLLNMPRRGSHKNSEEVQELMKGIIPDNYKYGLPIRILQLIGKVPHTEKGKMTKEYSQRYDKSRYLFMLDAPFRISNKCCSVMKKAPLHKYAKESGRVPMVATMAAESYLRQSNWIKYGCNHFDSSQPISNPISFWTEQDVLQYIKENNLPLASVYGDIVPDNGSNDHENQMDISDLGVCADNRPLKTTGCNRTGCMFCGYGCHVENNPNRFERMKETHPKQYEWIMRDWEKGGLGYKKVIDWINEHGGFDIKY